MDSSVNRMQIFYIVILALFVMLSEARNIDPRNVESRNVKYIATGRSVSFSSNAFSSFPMKTDLGMFKTDLTANLSASCTVKLPCSGFAYVIGIGYGSELLSYFCTSGSSTVFLNTRTSVGTLHLTMFSGFSPGSHYSCQIQSIGATTTKPITKTTRPSTTTTRLSTTTTRPNTTTIRLSTTTTTPNTTTTRPSTTTTRPSTTTNRLITTTTGPSTMTTRPSTTTTRPITTTTKPTTGPLNTTRNPEVIESEECQCGTIGGPKNAGGTYVREGDIPWQAGIGFSYYDETFLFFCAGTLISSNFVITTAYCGKSFVTSIALGKIFLGSVDLMSPFAVVVGLSKIMPHEKYNSMSDYDISIIKLDKTVTFTSKVFPACLPRKLSTETFDGKSLVVSGWGTTELGGTIATKILQKTTVVGISNAQCLAKYGSKYISSEVLCATPPGKDTCRGDNGGPLTYTESGVTYLVGVVSFGRAYADPKFAGGYARVTRYLSWIDSKTGTPVCSK